MAAQSAFFFFFLAGKRNEDKQASPGRSRTESHCNVKGLPRGTRLCNMALTESLPVSILSCAAYFSSNYSASLAWRILDANAGVAQTVAKCCTIQFGTFPAQNSITAFTETTEVQKVAVSLPYSLLS